MGIGDEHKLVMQPRPEGGLVAEGMNYTDSSLSGPGRLHLDYRRDVGDKILCLHIAIPRDTASDPRTWSVFEDFIEKKKEETNVDRQA